MKNLTLLALFTISILSSCNIETREIRYGEEKCHFCNMTVGDTKHSAQAISEKGEIYVYGSIECLMRENIDILDDLSLVSVNDFSSEKELINAKEATFLIHEDYSSPMGANLNAVANRTIAEELNSNHKGHILNWDQLKIHFEIEKKNSKSDVMKCQAGKCAPGKCGSN